MSAIDFEKTFINSPESIKLKFLEAKIKHDPKLQSEFISFVNAGKIEFNVNSIDDFLKIIHSTKEEYTDLFEAVDIENPDWESYHPPHSGYIEEWEAYQMASEQEFESIFEIFHSQALNTILAQKTDELIAILIGLYDAASDATIPDDTGSFDDVNEYLQDEHKNTMNQIIEKLRLSAVSGPGIDNAIELFISYCDREKSINPGYYEPLLLALAEKSDNPGRLLDKIGKSSLELNSIAELILLLQRKSGNKTAWLKTAELYYRSNKEVAKQLLEHYFETDKQAFLKVAGEVFPTDKSKWSKFLQKYLTPEFDKTLFMNVCWQLTTDEKQLVYYHKMKEYLSEADINRLLDEVRSDKVFQVTILASEKRYAEIQTIVKENPNDWHYNEMIAPILRVYPSFCFENIKTKIEKTLLNDRGRSVYERIVSWIQLTEQIPGFQQEKHILINQTYNHKPNLPALRDEMRKARLV